MKKILLIFFVLNFQLCLGQNIDRGIVAFNRFNQESGNFDNVHIDDYRLIEKVSFLDYDGWMSEKSLQRLDDKNTVLIEIATDKPYGEYGAFIPGLFQLAFSIPNKVVEVSLDTMNVIHIDNFEEFEFSGRTISGKLEFLWEDDKVIINGSIKFLDSNSITRESMDFKNSNLEFTTIGNYRIAEKLKEARRQKQEKKILSKIIGPSIIRKNFFDSVFSISKFPNNDLSYKFSKSSKKKFLIDQSYVLPKSKISENPSDDLMGLLGSSIYYSSDGTGFVFNFHHFDEGDSNMIDDETNYSFLFSLPELEIKTYDIQDDRINVNLSYWHYGPLGQVIDTKSASGTIQLTAVSNGNVEGIINLSFKMTDKRTMSLTGNFQLPLVDKSAFRELADRMKLAAND